MDGVERIMVLGIFAVIVAILGVAAWSVTQDGGLSDNDLVASGLAVDSLSGRDSNPAGAADGGASAGSGSRSLPKGGLSARRPGDAALTGHGLTSSVLPLQRPTRQEQLADQDRRRQELIGAPKVAPQQVNGPANAHKSGKPPAPTGHGTPSVDGASGTTPGQAGALAVEPSKPAAAVKAPVTQPAPAVPATVKAEILSGDSLWKLIKRTYQVPSSEIQRLSEEIEALNPGIDIARVFPGQVILVPNPALLDRELAQTPPAAMPVERVAVEQPSGFRLYTVRESDTLSKIAREQVGGGTTWQGLYDLNRRTISDPNNLPVGLTIKLPVKP